VWFILSQAGTCSRAQQRFKNELIKLILSTGSKKGSQELPFSKFSNRLSSRRLLFRFLAVFLTELLDTAGSIDDFLFTCIERMTNRANLDMQGFAHGGAGLKSATATAGHGYFLIIWMNVWLHEMILSIANAPRTMSA
jgi:hypothetical protein